MSRPRGSFVWADLVPGDQDRAIAFYVELLDWWTLKAAPEDGGYALAFLGEQGLEATVGGISKTIPGVPPVWTPYLATDAIDHTVALAEEHGGRVIMPVHEAEGMGRVAIVTEPTGVPFGLWESTVNDGFGATPGPGVFVGLEFSVPDAAATAVFFSTLFGLQSTRVDEQADRIYHRLAMPGEEQPQFAVHERADAVTSALYIQIADADEATARIARAGGELTGEPIRQPFGTVLELLDTEGATVRLLELG